MGLPQFKSIKVDLVESSLEDLFHNKLSVIRTDPYMMWYHNDGLLPLLRADIQTIQNNAYELTSANTKINTCTISRYSNRSHIPSVKGGLHTSQYDTLKRLTVREAVECEFSKIVVSENVSYNNMLSAAREYLIQEWTPPKAASVIRSICPTISMFRSWIKHIDKTVKIRSYDSIVDIPNICQLITPYTEGIETTVIKHVFEYNFPTVISDSELNSLLSLDCRIKSSDPIEGKVRCRCESRAVYISYNKDNTFKIYPHATSDRPLQEVDIILNDLGAVKKREVDFTGETPEINITEMYNSGKLNLFPNEHNNKTHPKVMLKSYTGEDAISTMQTYSYIKCSSMKIPDLKSILDAYNMKSTGNKEDLVDLVAELVDTQYHVLAGELDELYKGKQLIKVQRARSSYNAGREICKTKFHVQPSTPEYITINNVLYAYIWMHLRNNAILDPTYENNMYSVVELIKAFEAGRIIPPHIDLAEPLDMRPII